MNVKKAFEVCILVSLIAGAVICCRRKETHPVSANTAPEYVLTYAENQSEGHPTTQGAYRFAELVYEKTNGRIKIKVHPNAELGDEVSVIAQVRFGGIDFTRTSIMTVSDVVPQFNVLQLPYLYRSSEHMWKVLDGEIGQEFMSYLDDYDMKGLSWYDAGARNFYTVNRKITGVEDLKELKIRVAESNMMEVWISELGAEAVPLPFSEVYSALETGRIDGAENNWPSYISMSHNKVARYVTVDEHSRIPEMQVVSKSTWNQLSEEDREIIQECAQLSAEYERVLWNQQEKKSRERMERLGCIVTELSPEETEEFRSASEQIYEQFCGEYKDIIDRIAAVD
ncbi:MAG: TRAP transporter substrate-binding protein [bacterium]|nr:TRAP transporter substrate-binding protein [bacterium]